MEVAERIDLRKCTPEAVYELKKVAVNLKKQNYTAVEIERKIGLHRDRVSDYWCEYKESGKILRPKVRGRKGGEKKLLTAEQEREIERIIVDKTPDQMKFDCFLWDLRSVQGLIKDKYGIEAGKETVREYLRSWGMSSQRPSKRAYKQSAEAVETFKNETFPEIRARAKSENAEIFFADESGINNQAYNPRGYAPVGQTPVVKVEVRRESVNVLAAISYGGHRKFMAYEETTTQQKLIEFMRAMIKDQRRRARKKVFLFLDNLRVHHGKLVQAFLEENTDKIEVFYFPSYSPDLNPQELLNNVMKQNIRSGKPPRNKKEIFEKATGFLTNIPPKKIKNLFLHPKVSYTKFA